ncbi:MAG: ribosome biogenesis GTPase Der [Meiothermus sp.]|uniref:ribosome biogenesis GTPase Der n=1 Tax=Meiothermus sp. TaxID=1955249 RepID=UPI00260150C6|nr:ribosome biogenesis GTPase Der [Meiothermus sp.]MCS7058102.1 ribosome biogenesis GTPase Der [Meiothermus sp.]MCS7193742.1 ribosome biogenesis GTPase Der [Meiothermus sp.]MCX7740781.1 ribosome biogenesis GTPase Der [Meiothermus sp.]MDW8090102.1 ribosome biogenesis GTPase Der [Meiothermus sp.]MDW8481406.1 ribosome biogenesis GTPase Der [Meiothermus sp.]
MYKVVIVGRPNVGKSSLFNRLLGLRQSPERATWAGSRFSVVADVPGVTRDLKEGVVESERGRFKLVDTGGLWSGDVWEEKIRQKVERAVEEADLILFAVDGRSDLATADLEVAEFLRRKGKPVLLVATKVDDPKHEAYLGELYALGFGEPLPTSAAHGRGVDELVERIWASLPVRQGESEPEVVPIRLAIVGRPNAGKSSLLNAILGEERVIVSEVPGTTRDSIDVEFDYGGNRFLLVDTAGIRKRPETGVEEQAILRAHQTIREADVVLLVVDPKELGDHELKLANEALEAGKPVVVTVTKWDLIGKEEAKRVRADLAVKLAHIAHLPTVYVSSVTGQNLHKLLSEAVRLYGLARLRFETAELNRWLSVWSLGTQMPNFRGKPLKLFFVTQPEVAPPTFVFFCNYPEFVTRAFEGYLRNRIGEDLGLREVPFRLVFRGRREG